MMCSVPKVSSWSSSMWLVNAMSSCVSNWHISHLMYSTFSTIKCVPFVCSSNSSLVVVKKVHSSHLNSWRGFGDTATGWTSSSSVITIFLEWYSSWCFFGKSSPFATKSHWSHIFSSVSIQELKVHLRTINSIFKFTFHYFQIIYEIMFQDTG